MYWKSTGNLFGSICGHPVARVTARVVCVAVPLLIAVLFNVCVCFRRVFSSWLDRDEILENVEVVVRVGKCQEIYE